MDVLLKVTNRFGTEGMAYDLAFASMFSAVPGVEETTLDRDEGVIIVTGPISRSLNLYRGTGLTP